MCLSMSGQKHMINIDKIAFVPLFILYVWLPYCSCSLVLHITTDLLGPDLHIAVGHAHPHGACPVLVQDPTHFHPQADLWIGQYSIGQVILFKRCLSRSRQRMTTTRERLFICPCVCAYGNHPYCASTVGSGFLVPTAHCTLESLA